MDTIDGIEEVEIRCWNCTCTVGKKLPTGRIFCKQCLVLILSAEQILNRKEV
mgnify:CR=1